MHITVTKPQGQAVPVVRDATEALLAPELDLSALGLHMSPGSFLKEVQTLSSLPNILCAGSPTSQQSFWIPLGFGWC